jgi:NAD(P)H dehydrogenase (quinone)
MGVDEAGNLIWVAPQSSGYAVINTEQTVSKFINSTIAVSGASGQLGRRVVALLQEAGATRIVALTRDPSKLADFAQSGVEVRQASFDDPAGLEQALRGVERFLIISTDTVGIEDGRSAQHARAIEAAERAGVKHLVYTSLTSPYPDPASLIPNDHYWTEARLAASPLDWTVLRNNVYADSLVQSGARAVASGTLYHAAGDNGRAYVTREDCAAAAAGALLKAEGKRIYDISGPSAPTMDDIAATLAKVSGKPVKAQNVPAEGLKAGLAAAGVPQIYVDVLALFDTDAAKGYYGIVTNAVAELAGRPAQSVVQVLEANRAALG